MVTTPLVEAAVIERSGLFDRSYYLETYRDVRASGVDPLDHFCNEGWRVWKYNPNALFDTDYYLSANRDVVAAGINPLFHYIRFGEAENRFPNINFDPYSYRRAHSIPTEESCLKHHLESLKDSADVDLTLGLKRTAEFEEIEDSGLFDANYYLINYPDIRSSLVNPLEHFCTYGWREGRRPNPYFDPAWYGKTYLVQQPGMNPLLHYLRQGRQDFFKPIVYFDPHWYHKTYGPVKSGCLLEHFLRVRRNQGHSPNEIFDVGWYVDRHGIAIGTNRDPFAHYLREGILRDIDPGPTFNAGAYRTINFDFVVPPSRALDGAEIHEKIRREAYNPLVHFLLNRSHPIG